jgi:hypothetical protein
MKAFTVTSTIKHTSIVFAEGKDEAIEIHKTQRVNGVTDESDAKIKAIRNKDEENAVWANAQKAQDEALVGTKTPAKKKA